jgi:hypothetical protein
MLASTVQFSNNDQPPAATTQDRPGRPTGPAIHEGAHRVPSGPNSVPDTPDPTRFRSTLSRAVLGTGQTPTAPNSQRSTHEQPASDTR